MEVRPIDANALLEKLKQNLRDYRDVMNEDGACATLIAIRDVEKAPTLDYEPVVHAHWNVDNSFHSGAKKAHSCSKCKYIAYQDTDEELHKRCPECGAKMDEEQK